ncbi:hypothetical protein ACQPW3_05770 [Actinosynnema sp. CA-248983]
MLLAVAAVMLGMASPALAANKPWTMSRVLTGYESDYWDTASGNTTIRVDYCGAVYPYGGSGLTLDLIENIAWAPDINRGGRVYVCSGSGGTSGGGSGTWTHSNGRFYFRVASTPNNYGTNAGGNVSYPG